MVQQPASKEQAEEHYQTTDQVGYSSIFEDDANEETDGSSCKVEENKSSATKKRAGIEENKRGQPVKQRQATRTSSRQQAESNFDVNFKICRGC